ncbi:DUF1345 domain-containing protein [Roseomonas sp. HJA6]|uniref:DUF1345 domain-containing protein n=1 Tax=Roseomonas alba TaxID=2846776 RepID=A0ABS7A813_9PROT|nr:DUF1345 domain-containing protein [Neoroseomonas alba]MBW6398406.1 DUF1345 domain-containing protein [Neoroseomonas alba]
MRLRLRERPTLLLALAVLVAMVVAARVLTDLPLRVAILLGWCAGAATHAAFLLHALIVTSPQTLRSRAEILQDSRWTVLTGTLAAALAALYGVVSEIAGVGDRGPHSITLGIGTLALSWAYLHIVFAVHYAHAYWLEDGGIVFPGGDRPDWAEFLYLSFTVGMTAQVSDVTTCAPGVRRMVLAHGLVSFVFNAAILGLAVNVLAGSAAG